MKLLAMAVLFLAIGSLEGGRHMERGPEKEKVLGVLASHLSVLLCQTAPEKDHSLSIAQKAHPKTWSWVPVWGGG